MRNPYQHIDLRVNDLEAARAFYSKILPAIGFEEGWKGKRFSGFDDIANGPVKEVLSEPELQRSIDTLAAMETLEAGRLGSYRIKVGLFERWMQSRYHLLNAVRAHGTSEGSVEPGV